MKATPQSTLIFLIALILVPALPARAQGRSRPGFHQPSIGTECEEIFKTHDMLEDTSCNPFCVWRDLDKYQSTFGSHFSMLLKKLKRGQLWVDFGAGEARAQLQFLKQRELAKNSLPNLLAVGVNRPAITPPLSQLLSSIVSPEHFKYEEKYLAKVDPNLIDGYLLGTDYFGPVSYAEQVDEVLQTYLEHLALDGDLFILINNDKTKIKLSETENLKLAEWLQTIPGLEVTTKPVKLEYEEGHPVAIHIKKLSQHVTIPGLKRSKFISGRPPTREYTLVP